MTRAAPGRAAVSGARAPRAVALAALCAASCLSRPALVPHTYAIDGPRAHGDLARGGGAVLALRPVEVAPELDGRDLVYRTAAHRLERDPYASFAADPGALLTAAVGAYLRASPGVGDVVEPGAEAPADLLVEVRATDLTGDFTGPAPRAGLALEVRVLTAGGGAPVLQRAYARARPVPEATADAVVAGWNAALAEIMGDLTRDLGGALAARR